MKTVVITGASSGIGFEAARALAHQGYSVIGIGHNEQNCARARERILAQAPSGSITYFLCDLMQQREVNDLAQRIAEYLKENCRSELHALINNAGCARSWYTTTEEGYEQQFALNYLAGFLLTYRLFPFLRNGSGRVIMTGSESHKRMKVHWEDVMLQKHYNPLAAYKQSKLCGMLFAKGFNDRFSQKGPRAYVIDPGLVKTDIGNKQSGFLLNLVWTLRKRQGISPEVPAKTFAFLCEENPAPQGLYYEKCREKPFSAQVTAENADRLFELSERLCGIRYSDSEADL